MSLRMQVRPMLLPAVIILVPGPTRSRSRSPSSTRPNPDYRQQLHILNTLFSNLKCTTILLAIVLTNRNADMTMYWAHHDKFIVIDYALAFIGGLDLCFGRYDTNTHQLSDIQKKEGMWPGQDFNNNRVMDFQKVRVDASRPKNVD